MLIVRHLEQGGRRWPAPVVTLGNFDGVHRGHQEILRRVVGGARVLGGTAVALTFHPHPAAVLAPAQVPPLLTDWRARVDRIAALGIDVLIVQRFTPTFATVTAADFVRRILVGSLGTHTVVVGHRVSFGHNREGGAPTLQQLGKECGFTVEVVGPVDVDGRVVSSSVVRRAVGNGELEQARAFLSRWPSVAGRVIHGHHRGRSLGFPTANLRIAGVALPPDGVYAVRVTVKGALQCGVANLGFNPTFGEQARGLEVHILDFDQDLYGQRLEVGFVHQLRGEVKFPNVRALVEQITHDAATARQVLAGSPL